MRHRHRRDGRAARVTPASTDVRRRCEQGGKRETGRMRVGSVADEAEQEHRECDGRKRERGGRRRTARQNSRRRTKRFDSTLGYPGEGHPEGMRKTSITVSQSPVLQSV